MENKKMKIDEEVKDQNLAESQELFEEVEEIVTADWTGCANCCS